MSKQKKVVITTSDTDLKPTASKIENTVTNTKSTSNSSGLVFGKKNYQWMLIGFGIMILGYLLMVGGHMPSPDVWDADSIYSFRRTVLAPFVILAGLGLQVKAIFVKND